MLTSHILPGGFSRWCRLIQPALHAAQDGHEQQNGKHSAAERERSARVLTGRCWMAENFPMSLRQLLPVLDVVGAANKHLARVGRFLQKYGDMDLFPVKLQARGPCALLPAWRACLGTAGLPA